MTLTSLATKKIIADLKAARWSKSGRAFRGHIAAPPWDYAKATVTHREEYRRMALNQTRLGQSSLIHDQWSSNQPLFISWATWGGLPKRGVLLRLEGRSLDWNFRDVRSGYGIPRLERTTKGTVRDSRTGIQPSGTIVTSNQQTLVNSANDRAATGSVCVAPARGKLEHRAPSSR
jgi:hypothetical protein